MDKTVPLHQLETLQKQAESLKLEVDHFRRAYESLQQISRAREEVLGAMIDKLLDMIHVSGGSDYE